VDPHAGWRRFLDGGQRRLDLIHHIECGGVAVLDDRQQHRSLALGVHDVLLYRPGICHVRDVGQVDGGGTDQLDWHVVQRLERQRHCIHPHDKLLVVHLRVAGGEREALRVPLA
jgi:hypothetical protein